NENGEITKLKTGTIVQALLEDENYLSIDCFPALNNGFGIAIANTTITKNNNSAKNHKPNQPSTFIYVSLIYPNEVVEQFLIYQSADANLKIEMMCCGTGYTIIGYRCALKLSKIENYWMRILFSSNGAVKSVKPLEFDQFQNSLLLIPNPLYYGGFFNLPNNLTISSFLPNLNFGIFLHNNTFVAIIPNENDNKNWQLISTEIPKLMPDVDDDALKLSSTNYSLSDNVAFQYSDSANGIMRLNVEGTNLFNLDSTNESEFNENLENGLANITPTNPICLKLIQTQMDYSISPPTLLLLFKINNRIIIQI
ncbi:2276_t:CDS:2, partial [Entrophospora sp. SA101]